MKIESLKIGQSVEISVEEARELLKNTEGEYDFFSLYEDHNTPEIGFETVINREYSIEKTGKKGSKIYAGSEWEYKTKMGTFEITMSWDFRHPSNFCENKNGLSRTFKFAI